MSDDELKRLWSDFGKNMHTVGLMMALSFVVGVTGIVALIFIFIAIGNLKRINFYLKDNRLEEFRSKYIQAFALRIIGVVVMVGGLVGMFFTGFYGDDWMFLLAPIVIGLIIVIAGGAIEMKAWDILKSFFEDQQDYFPAILHRDLVDGCDNLKTAALMYLLSFLVITLLIGIIFQIMGYFKLAKLKDFIAPYYQTTPTSKSQVQTPSSPVQSNSNASTSKYCPNCGAQIKGTGNFCAECGSSLS
jgi:MFS family permease